VRAVLGDGYIAGAWTASIWRHSVEVIAAVFRIERINGEKKHLLAVVLHILIANHKDMVRGPGAGGNPTAAAGFAVLGIN